MVSGNDVRWITAGAGDAEGQMAFTLANRDDSSTFGLTEEEARKAGLRQVIVGVTTLNEIVKAAGLPADMVKVDAERMDFKVLAGASDIFGRTEIFLVETAICAIDFPNTIATVIDLHDR